MDSETYDLYSQNVQNYIYDEDKIVTYKWLSLELGIHIEQSKHLLSNFFKDQEAVKPGILSVTYLLYGTYEDNGFGFILVQDCELNNARKKFKHVLNEFIYSVQKKTDNIDLNALYIVDKGSSANCLGAIGYNRNIEKTNVNRPKPVIEEKKVEKIENGNNPHITEKPISFTNMFQKVTKRNIQKEFDSALQGDSNDASTKQSKPVKAAKTGKGIANFFSKTPPATNNSQKPKVEPETREKNNVDNETKYIKKTEDKENSSKNEKPSTNENSKKKDVQISKKSYLDLIDKDDEDFMDVDVMEKKTVVEEKTTKKRDRKNKKTTNKRTRSNDNKEGDFKIHKRIKICDTDSSDDDIFASNDRSPSPDLTVEPDDEVLVPPTPEVSQLLNSRRVRKLVEKTYQDEEGFMVTKKEVVYETASEDESEKEKINSVKKSENENLKIETALLEKQDEQKTVASTNKNTKKDKKSKSSPKKQATLMNFFKKS